jgi:hypothetical protein
MMAIVKMWRVGRFSIQQSSFNMANKSARFRLLHCDNLQFDKRISKKV